MEPCKNPKCDNQEATPVCKFNSVVFYMCEKCRYQFSIGRHGFASEEEVELLQRDQYLQAINTGTYRAPRYNFGSNIRFNPSQKLRQTISKVGYEGGSGNVKMYHPMHRGHCDKVSHIE